LYCRLSESGATAALQQLNSKQCPVAVVATAARHASAAKCGGRSSVVGDIFQTLQHRGITMAKKKSSPAKGRITKSTITFRLKPSEIKKAQACLAKSGSITYTFKDVTVTKLPKVLDDGKLID
jgi:hypothetical protein